MKLNLLGEYQIKNCSLALAAAELLKSKKNFNIETSKIQTALEKVEWPCRFDVRKLKLNKISKTIIIDGAHNISGVTLFAKTWGKSIWGKSKHTFIFGVLKDKNYFDIIKILSVFVKRIILVSINSFRQIDNAIIMNEWCKYIDKKNIETALTIEDAFLKTEKEKVVVVIGSLYLAGDVLKLLNERRGDHVKTLFGN